MTTLAAQLREIADQVAALEAAPPPIDPPPPVDPPDDPPPVVTGNLLLDAAGTLAPGEWRRVATTWPGKDTGRTFKQFQTVSTPGGGSADGMGWTERLVEHQGELLLPLMRDAFNKALAVMDAQGNWKRIEAPAGWSARKERRPFNRWFRDERYAYFSPSDSKTAMGYFLRTPLEDPGVFERYGIPIGDDQMDTVGNFSTCLAHEWGRFFAYTPGGKLYSWADGETAWRDHFSHIPKGERNSGYAGTVIWNPVKREIITIGGQTFGANPDPSYRVLRLTAPDGKAEIFDATFEDGTPIPAITAGSSRFIVHPVTGEYLMLYRSGVMYRSDDAVHWTVYEDLTALKPWGAWEQYCPWVHLSGTPDVLVMVSHIMGVWLHRLKDDGDIEPPPPPPPPPPPGPDDPPPVDPPLEPPMTSGILASTIEGMAPGEIRLVLADISHFKVQTANGGYWIIDWNPRMHWHAQTQQLVLFGHRIAHRVVAFSDTLGHWRDIPLWPGYVEGGNGHWYGWSADDGAGGIYAKGRRLDVASETWTDIASVKPLNGNNGTMYAWQSNVQRLVRHGGDIQRWQEYDPATNAWTIYKDKTGHGQHAEVEFHPLHGCSLLIGGNNSKKLAKLVSPGWTDVQALPDCPGEISMSGGSWVIPHPDGGWLVRAYPATGLSRVYGIRPGEAWRDLGEFPKLGLGYQSAAFDPVRRVVMIATTTGLHAWKLPVEGA